MVLANCLCLLSLPKKSLVRITDCPDMTSSVYHGGTATNNSIKSVCFDFLLFNIFLVISGVIIQFLVKHTEGVLYNHQLTICSS